MKPLYWLFAVAFLTACSAAPKPEVASAPQPVRGTEARPETVSDVNLAPEIAAACNMPTLHFAFDSASLEPDRGLDGLADCFLSGPMKGRSMKLVGHADPRGETEYNLALGQRRAGAVESYLERRALPDDKVASTSRGEFDASGIDEAGWARDRRVDVLLGD